MNEITVNYELTAEDCSNFGKENSSSQAGYHPMLIMLLIMYVLFIVSDIIYAIFFGALNGFEPKDLLISVFARFLLTLVLLAIASLIINLIIKRNERKISEIGKNALVCEHQLILSEKEVIETTDFFINRSSWKVIGELKESENFLFFGSATAFTYIIPKRYFDNRQQIKEFVDVFETYRQRSLNEYSPSYFADSSNPDFIRIKEMN